MENKDAMLEEYKSLREEIMRRQEQRLLVLAFTLTAVGSTIGFSLSGNSGQSSSSIFGYLPLIGFVLILIIAATTLTIQMTQQCDLIASYIRKFIEPQIEGLKWETRWERYGRFKTRGQKYLRVPLSTSKSLAVFYALLAVAAYATGFANGFPDSFIIMIPVSVLALLSLAFCFDLYSRKSNGWKKEWDGFDSE